MEVLKGREGLLHISNISKDHVKNVEDVLKEGQEVEVKVIGIDQQGKISLSRKELLKDSEDQSEHQ
ncbi:S1 RNA binding domain protein [Peptoniphilus sp. oral taxon 375 str. F0436]|nr:S1 RNA binding domain protein [Peptoniphilus sp. oral taxon 375 str. F0436]